MQDRYAGDIGDFGKLGLLRVLRSAGLSVGVNWYLTPDETHNDDGRHVEYLHQEDFRKCDGELWLALRNVANADQRKVSLLEDGRILQATFFSERLGFAGKRKAERLELRGEWFARSLGAMAARDVVFVDPDNGLVVPSALGRPREVKYVLPGELAAYYAQGSTVVYYQHKARRKDDFYADQLEALLRRGDLPGASGLALKFERVSQRYYMFLVQPRHSDAVERAVNDMLSARWGDHFRRLERCE